MHVFQKTKYYTGRLVKRGYDCIFYGGTGPNLTNEDGIQDYGTGMYKIFLTVQVIAMSNWGMRLLVFTCTYVFFLQEFVRLLQSIGNSDVAAKLVSDGLLRTEKRGDKKVAKLVRTFTCETYFTNQDLH